MAQELIECKHCKGTGTCIVGEKSCDACLKAKDFPIKTKAIVPCDCCKGLGKNSLWDISTRESLSRPIEDTLTGYSVKQEQNTIRILDKRRFVFSIITFVVGLIFTIIGIFSNNLNAILPVASGLMTGAIGYYIGGQLNQSRKNYDNLKNDVKQAKGR